MLSTTQQIETAINKANRILVAFRAHGDGDAIGSALALTHTLQKIGKRHVVVASDGFTPPAHLAFLPKITEVCDSLTGVCTYAIELSMKDVQLKHFQYDVKDDKLRIFLTPETGAFRPEYVRHAPSPFAFDLIITVGTPDLESLGDIYHRHTDFFTKTPIINIDHDPANEHYGHINHVDVTATSTGETLYDLVEQLGRRHMDAELATYLLTSIIAKTRGFRVPRLSPKTLQITSQLVAHGADREKIMHHLYRSRSLGTLKLWGRVLSRLEYDMEVGIAWSTITLQDFVRTEATHEHLPDIVDELIANAPGVKATAIFYEHPGRSASQPMHSVTDSPVSVMVCAQTPHSALDLARDFQPNGSKERAHFDLPSHTLEEAKQDVLAAIRNRMATVAR